MAYASTSAVTAAPTTAERIRWRELASVAQILRRHWAFGVLFTAGAVLRGLIVVAYHPAFFYFGDSYIYHAGAHALIPDPARPFGYPFFLLLMEPLGELWRLVVGQHIAGLCLGLTLYAFLLRRGVSRLVAVIVLAPVLLDPRTAILEHYVLTETLFTWLMVGGALVLCRSAPPGWIAGAAAGALFTAAALTRTVGLAILVLPMLYLLVRRVGWRAPVAFAAVVAIGLGGYVSWYHHVWGTYSFGTHSGRFLYSRVATFVDCGRLELTPDERRLCPAQPLDQRRPPDLYLWGPDTANTLMQEGKYDAVFSSFARKAILAQPVDYARTVMVDTVIFMRLDAGQVDRPGHSAARARCLGSLWEIPVPGVKPPCSGFWVYGTMTAVTTGSEIYEHRHALSGPLSAYSRYAQVPTTVIGLAVLFALVLTLWPGRRPSVRQSLDPLLWGGLGLGLVAGSVATSALDPRYAVPSLPLALIAAGLAWGNFVNSKRVPDGPPEVDHRPERPDSATDPVVNLPGGGL